MKTNIVFASNNLNKVKEIQEMIPNYKILSLKDLDPRIDIDESADDLKGNALIKANYVLNRFKLPCFADDTGLEVDALDGQPGVYSARYAGLKATDKDNMDLLLNNLEGVENRSARFRTVIAFVDHSSERLFEGVCEGAILERPEGSQGFGYDPIFQPKNEKRSFAQMSSMEKSIISHRGLAVGKLIDFLKNYEKK